MQGLRPIRQSLCVAVSLVALASGCTDSVTPLSSIVVPGSPVVRSVEVDVDSTLLTMGSRARASARALDANGNPITGRAVTWGSSNPEVITLSGDGVVSTVAPGVAKVLATIDGVQGARDLVVRQAPPSNAAVATVKVSLPRASVRIGEVVQATATPIDSAGRVLPQRSVTWSVASGTGIVSVSAAGLVTAIANGSAQVAATIDGVRGTASLTVSDSASGVVALPQLPETLSFSFPQVRGKQWVVRAGDNLQSVLNSASRGDEIVLQAGATFSGNFTLPPKPGTPADGWIIIRSDKLALMPPQGTRVIPVFGALMPKVVTPNTGAALSTPVGASGWWIAGVEFSVDPSVTAVIGRVVALGVGGAPQTTLAVVPTDLVLDRVYIHPQPSQGVQRCLELNSARTALQDSYLMDCHASGFDSQAIVGWNGPGPYRIVNNTLAGAGENIMFGGADPVIPDLIPGDIQLEHNYIYTPVTWKGVWTKKNLVETKNVQRFLIRGNVLDGSWTDGQVGYAFVLKVANQSGRCTWCAARDIIIRDNLVRNAGAGLGITGKEGSNPNPVGELLNRLLVEHNVFENINAPPFTGDARLVSIMQDAQNVTIRHNTMTAPGSLSQFLNLSSIPAATNFAFDENVVSYGEYGLFSSKYGVGEGSLAGFNGSVSFVGNVIIGPQKSGYPRSTFVSSLAAALSGGAGADQARVNAAIVNVIIP